MHELPDDVRALYPFPSRFLSIGEHRLHYVDEGDGEPLVLLHGNPTWSFYWRELIGGLRDRWRVIAPDHLGCGLSDKPQRYPYTLSTHIENVSKLIDHLGLREINLGVHDWGGAIGFGWAVRNVSRVKRMIVFNTAAFFGPCPWRIRICRMPLMGAIVVRGLNGFALPATWMACKNRVRMTSAVRRGYLLPYDSYANRVAVLEFVRDIPLRRDTPTGRRVAEIEAGLPQLADKPMLICWGGRDFCFHDGFLDEWRRRFPEAEVHCFADAGHYVVEDAGERLLPLIRGFLDEGPHTRSAASSD
ncbi:MAG: alpha/beta fold hydrolase [Phycisphaerae bacterium]|nr:alpha/beta fold hydrolase [Phycisphaerae bacterium]